jgi:hypothetical protein
LRPGERLTTEADDYTIAGEFDCHRTRRVSRTGNHWRSIGQR